MNILAIDVGGTHVKVLLSGETTPRKFESGRTLTAKKMVERVKEIADGWNYDAVSIGYPGPVLRNRPVLEPHNLGKGWVGFDYARAFGKPVMLINDAAMQALGSYKKGKMLFLSLGTGLRTALVVGGIVEPMELATCLIRRQPSKTTSGFAAWKNAVKRNGVVMLPTSCSVL
jgi:polyphosphate glucokinase